MWRGRWKVGKTFFCVVTFILPKDWNSSINLRELTQTLKISDTEQVPFMLHGSKTNTSENFNQNIEIIIILKKLVVLKIRYFN